MLRVGRWLWNVCKKTLSSSGVQEAGRIEIDGRGSILSVEFLIDGKHVVSGDRGGKIRRWQVEDGTEVGMPMDAGHGYAIRSMAVSRDGKWVVNAAESGEVTVWNAESHEKVNAFRGYGELVDLSPDGTRIATGLRNSTVCIWSSSTGHRFLNPMEHDDPIVAVKFSTNGRLIATAANSVRIYNSQSGDLLVDVPVRVSSSQNQSLAWTSDSTQLFFLSHDGNINCIDTRTRTICFQWPIHSIGRPNCIAITSNGAFVAASAGSSISFWDTTTHEQIGSIVQHTDDIESMAISANYKLVVGGCGTITLCNLFNILPRSYSDNTLVERHRQYMEQKAHFEDTITCLRAQEINLNSEIAQHKRLCDQLSDSQRAAAQQTNETIKLLRTQDESSNKEITRLREIVSSLSGEKMSLNNKITHLERQFHIRRTYPHSETDGFIQATNVHKQKRQCEVLLAEGCVVDATISLLDVINGINERDQVNESVRKWVTEFKDQCISKLEQIADEASSTGRREEASVAYSTVLLLSHVMSSTVPDSLLSKLADTAPTDSAMNRVLTVTTKLSEYIIHRTICDILEEGDHPLGALECLRRMSLEKGTNSRDVQIKSVPDKESPPQHGDVTGPVDTIMNTLEQVGLKGHIKWADDLKARCLNKLERHGDHAVKSASYEEAISHYTTALTLNPESIVVLTKRSKALAWLGLWQAALKDADTVIQCHPESSLGYEGRHIALLHGGRYDEAINAYKGMLQKLEQSNTAARSIYISPSKTEEAICDTVWKTQEDAPLVLIDVRTGRLCDRDDRLDEFKASQNFKELVASTTERLDNLRIRQTVQRYFRYATFSHTWRKGEPMFREVHRIPVHRLAESPTVLKLVKFCNIVQGTGIYWAWSDTCCIDKDDSHVLQKSLTSMFRWYSQSTLTIVHLEGVHSDSELDALLDSRWFRRVWTLQELFASRTIHFYTENWEPFLPYGSINNHKDAIMSKMATANGVGSEVLCSLHPGRTDARLKLRLAAARTATEPEDMAYSLLGMFNISIPVKYGEGQQTALGHLLERLLTWSGDLSILAWTGKASDYNSCLPADISVYQKPASDYIPSLIEDKNQVDQLVEKLQKSLNLNTTMELYQRVVTLSSPQLVHGRLKLACFMFPLRILSHSESDDSRLIYRISAHSFRDIEIKTAEVLFDIGNLVLVHPWINCLLGQPVPPTKTQTIDDGVEPRPLNDGEDGDSKMLSSRALSFFACLNQRFGALLLVQQSHNEYKRVVPDCCIIAEPRGVSPAYLVRNIRTIDIV